jgi:ParB family transcriptional regulator, chromosome partitioning protein
MPKRKALGKGLSLLIPETEDLRRQESGFFECPVEAIEPNPYQPRQTFQSPAFDELVESVRQKGIITPLLVTKTEEGYRLIAGERRWRAAQKAGLETVPVVVKEVSPIESLELALIENIHREDLNPIEEAQAYQRWLEDTDTTQDVLAKKLGKDRSTVANLLRLLKLPRVIQQDLVEDRLSMGHARVLAGLKTPEEQKALRDLIIKKSLSVRQTEALATRKQGTRSARSGKEEEEYYYRSLTENLRRDLGTKVEIRKRGKNGSIIIHFYSDEELDRLLEHLSG